MARIKIEDLPPFEALTPEEQRSIVGAGRAAFMPMFAPTEDEALMEVAFAYASSPALMTTTREMALDRELFPSGSGPVDRMFRALAYPDLVDFGYRTEFEPVRETAPARVSPPKPAPLTRRTCDRETAQRAADALLEVLRRDLPVQRGLFQIRSAEPRGVRSWDLNDSGAVRGCSAVLHLEFRDILPGFDARSGDLVLVLGYAGREGSKEGFRVEDCQFTVAGVRSDAHSGLEICIREWYGQPIPVDDLPPPNGSATVEPPAPTVAPPVQNMSPVSLYEASAEARVVALTAGERFSTEVIHRGINPWMFQEVLNAAVSQNGDEITLVLEVDYGISGAPAEKHKQATVEITFILGGWSGNQQLYQFKRLGFSKFEGSFAGQLEERLREVFAAGVGIPRFDPKQVADNAVAVLKFVLCGDCFLREFEAVDRGVQVQVSVGSGEYQEEGWQALLLSLHLRCADLGEHAGPNRWLFICDTVGMTASNGDKWFEVDRPARLRDALRGVAIPANAVRLPVRNNGESQVAVGVYFAADPVKDEDDN